MKIFKRNILFVIILLSILFLLIGCSSNVNAINEIDKEEVVLKVEGIEVTYIHYSSLLESVKRGLINRENDLKNSGFDDSFVEKLVEIETKYGPSTIALANLILDYAMYAEALRIGITVSENEVQELIDIAKQAFSDEEIVITQSIKDFIERLGEEYYWQRYLPDVYERFIYGNKLFHKIIAESDISLFQISLVKEADIEIVNNELFDRNSVIEAIKYLEVSL